MSKYTCPSCDRQVFNRRLPNCEFCGQVLPYEMLLPLDEQKRIDEESSRKLRAATAKMVEQERRLREKRRRSSSNGDHHIHF